MIVIALPGVRDGGTPGGGGIKCADDRIGTRTPSAACTGTH